MTKWSDREKRFQKWFLERGNDVVLRTTASHGIFDLIVLRTTPPYQPILFLQQKTSAGDNIQVAPEEINKLLEESHKLPQYIKFRMLFVWFYDTDKEIIELRDISRLKHQNRPMSYWAEQWNPTNSIGFKR